MHTTTLCTVDLIVYSPVQVKASTKQLTLSDIRLSDLDNAKPGNIYMVTEKSDTQDV